MKNELEAPEGEILIFPVATSEGGVRVLLEGNTAWLTINLMAELYQTSKQNVSLHIKTIYEEGELSPEATVKQYLTVQTEGDRQVKRLLDYYNLEVILAVGYRVRSTRGSQFRQWATSHLKEYLEKGFLLNDERLKGGAGLVDHFDELLARIREIRASEVRVYQRIREIFSLAVDYNDATEETNRFFATMQNKMHFAATGHTAAEIVRRRADAAATNMGLTNWKGGRVLKRDVGTAKNYLNDEEIDTLNRITVMFLDQAEFRAKRRRDIQLADWEGSLNKFLADTELPVLEGAGSIGHQAALDWAEEQYDHFVERRRQQDEEAAGQNYLSDLEASAKRVEMDRNGGEQKNDGQGGSND